MKKILILSYHFEPMNVIASQRALGYANHFKKFGFEPTIVTHQWDKKFDEQLCSPKDFLIKTLYEENKAYKVYKMPIANFRRGKILSWIEKTMLKKLGIIVSWITGHLDTRGIILNCKLSERYFLKEHLKTHKYDVIMGIFSPHYHLSNCYWAYKRFKLPYVLDYRDLWDNNVLKKERKFNWQDAFRNTLTKVYWKKWNKRTLFNTSISNPFTNFLNHLLNQPTFVITNGFEEISVHQIKKSETFIILSLGTIYSNQNIQLLLDAIAIFLKEIKIESSVEILFLGAQKTNNLDNKLVLEKIKSYIPADFLKITQRLPKYEAQTYLNKASLLLFPTTPNIPGTYSGKIFEYISSGIPIIAAPRDNGTVDKLIDETKTGICSDSIYELAIFIKERYEFWTNSKGSQFKPDWEEINKYSRESQTEKLSILIEEVLR